MNKNYNSFYILGCKFYSEGDYPKALNNFKKSISLNPQFAPSYNDLGNIYKNTHDFSSALKCYLKALKYLPDSPIILTNIGVVQSRLQNWKLAIKYFVKAIVADPNYSEAHYGLGVAYYNADLWQKALDSLQKTIKLNSSFAHAKSFLTFLKMQICDWNNLPKYDPLADSPIFSISRLDDPKINLETAKAWSSAIEKKVESYPKFIPKKKEGEKKKLTIGYLSNDFYNHATSYLINGLFACHDKNKFTTNIYSYGPTEKNYYLNKFKKEAGNFTDISKMSDYQAAVKIYSDSVDILVDMKGFTGESRMEILAFRPSPIQVTWLGFPGTTGANFIDYIITDKVICNKKDQKYYSEKFAYMSNSYQINDFGRKISSKKYSRKDFGLPKKGFVFCCFNRPTKIEPKVFGSWMKILKKVPGSVLWLWKENILMVKNLRREAKKVGVNPNRLIFSTALPLDRHLARLGLSDLALDTFIYNGHTTTSDSLWASVPVITLKGKHFASRVSSSLLTAVGLPELITNTQKEYEDLVVELATHPKKLKTIVNKLQVNKLTSSLFDTQKFVKNLENVFQKVWNSYILSEKNS